ncbi:hypothetical protein CASFOL_019938 [Castilleja foliolosa]|uniref:KIB1-4 beta-propeller domain-containing protein n=1 Tax=Castilleja foliolosa TaxID=1961234 RepID=A0ABD3CZE9_9LAMI
MGEKKMIKKEIKSPSKKKAEPSAVVPSISRWSWFYYNKFPISCPSFSNKNKISWRIHDAIKKSVSGFGGVTKSWISSRCTHHTWPQLAETNNSPNFITILYRELDNIPLRSREEPYSDDNRYMEFANVIRFPKKNIYAISRQGSLAFIELDVDSGNYEITALGRSRVVPNCRMSKHFREYLLEYKGEIYVVFLLSRVSIKVVDNVEVFRLDKSRLLLEKVDRLVGDAMFFLQDNRCMGISASSLGCSEGSNCVYFTHDKADGTWFVYDMKSSCISTTSGPEIGLFE